MSIKSAEREKIQKEIEELSKKRQIYINDEMKKEELMTLMILEKQSKTLYRNWRRKMAIVCKTLTARVGKNILKPKTL